MVFKRGRMALTDPGAPLYNSKTFSDRRYDILYCRSRGHSVPVINGREQKNGLQYRGELSVEGLNEAGTKRATIDMTRAYPGGTVRSLVRTLALDHGDNSLAIEDAYRFSKRPRAVEEAFVTFEKAVAIRKGRAVRIGPARGGVTLSAWPSGRFRVDALVDESEDARPGGPALQRITFVPARLADEFVLRFCLR
jgi:hypothetical protein